MRARHPPAFRAGAYSASPVRAEMREGAHFSARLGVFLIVFEDCQHLGARERTAGAQRQDRQVRRDPVQPRDPDTAAAAQIRAVADGAILGVKRGAPGHVAVFPAGGQAAKKHNETKPVPDHRHTPFLFDDQPIP